MVLCLERIKLFLFYWKKKFALRMFCSFEEFSLLRLLRLFRIKLFLNYHGHLCNKVLNISSFACVPTLRGYLLNHWKYSKAFLNETKRLPPCLGKDPMWNYSTPFPVLSKQPHEMPALKTLVGVSSCTERVWPPKDLLFPWPKLSY